MNDISKDKDYQECTYFLHSLILEKLLIECNVLIINYSKRQKTPTETNWKQKFQKPQNENICLTYLNTEMNGNFHFLSFGDMIRVSSKVPIMDIIVRSTINFVGCVSWKTIYEKCVF